MSSTSEYHMGVIPNLIIKPSMVAGLVYVGKNYILRKGSMETNLKVAGCVLVGMIIADALSTYVIPQNAFSTLEGYVLQLGLGVGAVIGAEKILGIPDYNLQQTVMVVAGAEILSSFLLNIWNNTGV